MSKKKLGPATSPMGNFPGPVRVRLKRLNCNEAIPYPYDGQGREWWQRLKNAFGTASRSFNQKGRGTLRLTAVDASVLPSTPPREPIDSAANTEAQNAVANTTHQFSPGEPEKKLAEQTRIDAERARDEAVHFKADTNKVAATERVKVDALLAELEPEKSAAAAEARATEVVAYSAAMGVIVLVLILASARSQNMQTVWRRGRAGSLKSQNLHQIQG